MGLWHEILWIDVGTSKELVGELHDVVLRDDGSISIDCTCGNDFYIVRLAPEPNTSQLQGEFQKGKTARGKRGQVTAIRYENQDAVLLKGDSVEDGLNYLWLAEINKAKFRGRMPNTSIE